MTSWRGSGAQPFPEELQHGVDGALGPLLGHGRVALALEVDPEEYGESTPRNPVSDPAGLLHSQLTGL